MKYDEWLRSTQLLWGHLYRGLGTSLSAPRHLPQGPTTCQASPWSWGWESRSKAVQERPRGARARTAFREGAEGCRTRRLWPRWEYHDWRSFFQVLGQVIAGRERISLTFPFLARREYYLERTLRNIARESWRVFAYLHVGSRQEDDQSLFGIHLDDAAYTHHAQPTPTRPHLHAHTLHPTHTTSSIHLQPHTPHPKNTYTHTHTTYTTTHTPNTYIHAHTYTQHTSTHPHTTHNHFLHPPASPTHTVLSLDFLYFSLFLQ